MNFGTTRRLLLIRDYAIGWTIAFLFLAIVRGVGTEEQGELQFGFWQSVIISISLGPAMGTISGASQIWMEERLYRRVSILRFLLLRLLYTLLFVLLLIVVAYGVYQLYFGTDVDILTFAFDEGSAAIYFYVLSVDFAINITRQVNLMLGPGNLQKILTGKFYHPREEERIFMFLDLQSSTQLAEELGHLKYSSLIQDCFDDLGVVIEEGAEIYQYVGDEAVLTWLVTEGVAEDRFLKAFLRFKKRLGSKESYYKENYGVKPYFKAGAHAGVVTVTEIGKYKKEIAYHGDPINTAARIQSKCNEFGVDLLVSKHVIDLLDLTDFTEPKMIGEMELRGKKELVTLYTI